MFLLIYYLRRSGLLQKPSPRRQPADIDAFRHGQVPFPSICWLLHLRHILPFWDVAAFLRPSCFDWVHLKFLAIFLIRLVVLNLIVVVVVATLLLVLRVRLVDVVVKFLILGLTTYVKALWHVELFCADWRSLVRDVDALIFLLLVLMQVSWRATAWADSVKW